MLYAPILTLLSNLYKYLFYPSLFELLQQIFSVTDYKKRKESHLSVQLFTILTPNNFSFASLLIPSELLIPNKPSTMSSR